MTDIPEQAGGPHPSSGSVYYQHSGSVPLASRLSYAARRQMFDLFMRVIQPLNHESVLDIGVTNDTKQQESNYFEQFYPYKSRIICVGTEDGSHLEAIYPGIRFIKVEPGRPLPFADKQFDIVFSNAVIEHVGSTNDQRTFIAEACRVGKRIFITTPNRWFPIEHHTGILLLHFLPKPIYRWILRRTSLRYWSHEEHLNPLTRAEFSAIFPAGLPANVVYIGVFFGPFRSNLAAFCENGR